VYKSPPELLEEPVCLLKHTGFFWLREKKRKGDERDFGINNFSI